MQIKMVKTSLLVPYENNPRHNEKAIEVVANSIQEFGFKVPLVIDANNVVVAGHTRLKAAERLNIETVPCIVADDLTPEKVKAFRLVDNRTSEFAEWDYEALQKELDDLELDLSQYGFAAEMEMIGDLDGENPYTKKVEIPIYEPTGEKPSIPDLVDTSKRDELVRRIQMAGLPIDLEKFLINAAQRHLVFNYKNIAEFYAHSDKAIQELFEESALVIIDFDKAIEYGYVKLSRDIEDVVSDED